MLPANLINALREYALSQKTPLPVQAAEPVQKNAPQLDMGQRLQAIVQTQLAPNVFKVNVAGQLIQMQLPPNIRSGDKVELQVVSLQPRLTFSMVNSANPLSTPEQLGSAARLLSSMSQQAPEKAYVRPMQRAPLWEAPNPPESKQLAGMLRETLSSSGLFYESHQAQWVGGGRTTAQLMHEPQNMPPALARAAAGNAGTPTPGVSSAPASTNMAAGAASETAAGTEAATKGMPAEAAKTVVQAELAGKLAVEGDDGVAMRIPAGSPDASASSRHAASTTDGKPVSIPEHLQPLVQQQLNALETRQMLWQGNVWPGQEMKWEVHEQAPQAQGGEVQRQWVTQIQMDLPRLGAVTATLRFNNAGLNLALSADNAETRKVLGGARSDLVSALSDAGISVLGAQVGGEQQETQT